jgi:hypothetical protein
MERKKSNKTLKRDSTPDSVATVDTQRVSRRSARNEIVVIPETPSVSDSDSAQPNDSTPMAKKKSNKNVQVVIEHKKPDKSVPVFIEQKKSDKSVPAVIEQKKSNKNVPVVPQQKPRTDDLGGLDVKTATLTVTPKRRETRSSKKKT